jgi:hypothetical protein
MRYYKPFPVVAMLNFPHSDWPFRPPHGVCHPSARTCLFHNLVLRATMEILKDALACIPQFKYAFDDTSPNKTVLRANLLTEDDAHQWIAHFGKVTKTNWIVSKGRRKEPKT